MENKENIIILGRAGLKYIDELGIEYFIDSEMVISEEYDFAIFADTIQFFEDYLKKTQPDNIILEKTYFEYKNKYVSDISKEKKEFIIKRVIGLCKAKNIKMEIIK